MSQHLKTLLKDNQELRPLLTKVKVLAALQLHFTAVAPPHLTQSVQILSLQTGTLSIAVANAAIAAKLRQLAPELVALLQNRGCEVSGIRVKVQVSFDRLQPKPAPHKLSNTAQNALKELSLSLNDSPLKHALDKIIKKN
ncbi:MAG: DciA family protein [Gallionella sp.]